MSELKRSRDEGETREVDRRVQSYEWTSAAALAQRLVESTHNDDIFERAEAVEFLGWCHFKAAFQSESREKFKDSMVLAESASTEASALFERASQPGLAKRAESRSLFARYWIADDIELRRRIIQNSISLATDAITSLERGDDLLQLLKTMRDILTYYRESLNLSSEWSVLNTQFQQALNIGRKCAASFDDLAYDDYCLEALNVTIWLLSVEAQILFTPTEFASFQFEARSLHKKMQGIVERTNSSFAICLTQEAGGHIAFDFDGDYKLAKSLYGKAAQAAQTTRDTLLIGRTTWPKAQLAYWLGSNMDSIEERRTTLLDGIELALSSVRSLEASKPTSDLAAGYATCANCHIEYANQVETEVLAKEAHLREAIRIAKNGTNVEKETWGWVVVAHALSNAMLFLSRIIPANHRRELLLGALPIREETVLVADRIFPSFWNPVVMRNYSALVKFDLAIDEPQTEEKLRLLEQSISDMGSCLELGAKWATSQGFIRRLGQFSEYYGTILNELFRLTNNTITAKQAIGAFDKSIHYFVSCGHVSAIGPIRWRIARIYDALGDFETASVAFRQAGEEFRTAAKKVSGLGSKYEELAQYMEAWNHTELARLSHESGDFSLSAQEYSNAADILQTSKTWDYLAGLFKARSMLEKGEGLSREESHDEAVRYFTSSSVAFKDARKELAIRLRHGSPVDQQEIADWLRVTEARDDYCHFRAELEEARKLDKEGERSASSRKYRSASEGFRAIKTTGDPQNPELDVLICFCEAWAKMQEAEAQSSPELYREAADRFLAVKESLATEKMRLLGLANSSICRALEAGTRFRQTREIQTYSDVKKWLDSAADYYREAGFAKTERWTRATQRLFDALVYLFQAETDKDPGKKANLYRLAESQLELAAKLYDEAGFPSKKWEVLGRLERAREERQVLVDALSSLSKIPSLTGSSLVPVSLSRGQPSGLERFEDAFVVGELSTPQNEIKPGTTLTLEMDFANVGKTAATLIKIDGLLQEGLAFDEAKNSYKRENGSINLAGKRLDRLQTFKAKIMLTAVNKGNYQLRPKIFFADDRGAYSSYDIRSNTLKVLESQSPSEPSMSTLSPFTTKVQLAPDFRFDSERAREVFQKLVNAFLKDYVSKKLSMDNAGWRSLMEIVREAKTPRSSFYGPQGKVGAVLAELERRGLVEVRVFPGERGRGGNVKKLRAAYDNRIVRDMIQKAVMTDS